MAVDPAGMPDARQENEGSDMNSSTTTSPIRRLEADSFAEAIRQGIVLVDFDEPSCGPSRLQLGVLEHLEPELARQVTLKEVNLDEAQELALRFQVESIPTLLLFKDGALVRRFAGVQHERVLARAIQAALADHSGSTAGEAGGKSE
jgi:thioredoxin 1